MSETIVGSVGVQLVPSAKGFDPKAKALLRGLRVPVDADTKPLEESVDRERSQQKKRPLPIKVMPKMDDFAGRIKSEAAAIAKSSAVNIPATIEGERLRRDIARQVASIEALTKIEIPTDLRDAAALRAKMASELETLRAMAEAAHPTVTVDVDTGKARAEMAGLRASNSGGGGAGGGLIGALAGGVAILGPALVPISAAFAGIAGYAGLTAVAVKKTADTQKKINALLHTAATTTSKKTYDSAVAQAKALEATVGGPQRKMLVANEALGRSFNRLVSKNGPALFAPIVAGMNLLARVMPHLTPLITAVSHALVDLIGQMSKGVASGGFDAFLRYVIKTIPPVLQFLGSFGSFLGQLFKSLAPSGMIVLNVLTGLFGLLSKIPGEVLAPIATGLIGLVGGPWVAGFAVAATLLATLFSKSEAFRNGLSNLAATVRSNLAPVWAQLVSTWQNQLLPALKQAGPIIGDLIGKWVVIGSAILGRVLPPIIKIGGIIFGWLIPALAKLEAMHFRGLVAWFNVLGRAAVTAAQVIGRAMSLILGVFAGVIRGIANVLSAISHVPKMGWAKQAASDMRAAAGTADVLANAVNNIPTWHDITISIHTVKTTTQIDSIYRGPKSGGTPPKIGTKPNRPKKVPSAPQVPTSFNIPSFGGGGGGGGAHKPKHKGPSEAQKAAERARKEAATLLKGLTVGVQAGGTKLTNALDNIRNHITDLPKAIRAPLRAMVAEFSKQLTALTSKLDVAKTALADIKQKYNDLASSIAQAFMPSNLFGGALADLNTGLADALTNVMNGIKAQGLLAAQGISNSFINALLASGNGALALQLAQDPALARHDSLLYGNITALSNQLGQTQADSTYGAALAKANSSLADISKQISKLAHQIGVEVGGELKSVATKASQKGGR